MTRILTLEEDFHATNVENNGLAHAGVKCGADDSIGTMHNMAAMWLMGLIMTLDAVTGLVAAYRPQ